jgi:spore coat protein U-like protein
MLTDNPVKPTAVTMLRVLLAYQIASFGSAATGASCSVQSTSLVFGAYDSLSAVPLDGVGSIRVDCDVQTSFTVDLSSGSAADGTRAMTSGASRLSYDLYTDGSRTLVWGDGISSADVSATGSAVDLPIYGRIAARQNVPAGEYVDGVVITISY